MTDSEGKAPSSLRPTDLEKEQIEALEVDGKVEAESSVYVIFRYESGYILCFLYLQYIKEKSLRPYYEFKTTKEIFEFLENN